MDTTNELRGVLEGGDVVDAIDHEALKREVERGLFGRGAALVVGRYEILHRLGGGGQGVVYVSRDPKLDRQVAVKLLRVDAADPGAHRRLLREATALAKLSIRTWSRSTTSACARSGCTPAPPWRARSCS